MTKRNNHLGYINHRIYTDVESYEVFTENGKTFAVRVKKVQATKPQFTNGFFPVTNLEDVWGGEETQEIGTPFEIKQRKDGVWGYTHEDCTPAFYCKDSEALTKQATDWQNSVGSSVKVIANYDELYCYAVLLTKTGRVKTHFHKLGMLAKECRYYYDYNF